MINIEDPSALLLAAGILIGSIPSILTLIGVAAWRAFRRPESLIRIPDTSRVTSVTITCLPEKPHDPS